jgi:hypothetical protein
MTVNDKIIEARLIPSKNLEIGGYLEGLQKDMIEQNEDVIDLTKETPQFKLEEPANKIVIN